MNQTYPVNSTKVIMTIFIGVNEWHVGWFNVVIQSYLVRGLFKIMDYVRCFLACNVHVLAHVIDGCMFLEEYALNESLSI